MRNKLLGSFQAVSLAVFALAMATGCTKSKENKNMVGVNYGATAFVAKAQLVSTMTAMTAVPKTFHLSRGIEEADSENTVGATPGMSDDFGLVEARITETELQFVSTFDPKGRKGTMKIVASYPITKQFDIIQESNDFGEHTNKVIEDETQPWNRRAYIRVDWSKPSTSLSKFAAGLDSRNKDSGENDAPAKAPLSEENTSLLEEPSFEPGHISFLVETSVKSDDKGTFTFPMSYTTAQAYRVVYRTHLLEAKASDFKPVPYTLDDFNRFGFFFTQQNFADPRGMLEKNVHLYANMHNVCEPGQANSCSTNRIRWVLSKDFPEKFKAVARRVVSDWNDTFKADLNRKDDVVYLDESTQATISDPSQNVLAYYPSRTKSGLLGVAQWVSDPRNGEFVGVRATIYGDGIDYEVATVDDMINIIAASANGGDPLSTVFGTTAFGTESGAVSPYNDKSTIQQFIANRRALGLDKTHSTQSGGALPLATLISNARNAVIESPAKANVRLANVASSSAGIFGVQELSVLGKIPADRNFPSQIEGIKTPSLQGLEQSLFMTTKLQLDKDKVLRDAELGIHGTELVEEAAIRYLYNYLKTHTPEELDKNRQMVEEQIAQETFFTTALHEMGHAFGLRHNFAGSADKNHYAKEYYAIKADLASANPTHTKEDLDPYASSSIMDYGRDFYSQRAGLGPYDRAAIKYAYNRSVDKNGDKDLNPANPYLFCTDHQVDESVLCRRFDKGANVSEVTAANILFYNTNFARMHYRRGRLSENLQQGWGSPGTLVNSLITRVFLPTRLVMDEFLYSFIVAENVPGASGYCTLKFINDSVKAGEIADICGDGTGDYRQAMEAAHVDPMNVLPTLVNALFVYNPTTGQPVVDPKTGTPVMRKLSSDFRPYGLADLLFANLQAQQFFSTVLGAPEPGTYIAMPSKDANGQQVFKLSLLDKNEPTVEAKLKAFAAEKGIEPTPDFLKQAASLVTNVTVAGYGRQLESVASVQGGFTRTEVLGAWWDKYAAIITLSAQGMPVEKYRVAKMNGNAYFLPQSKEFAVSVFGKMIADDNTIASIPVVLKNQKGEPVVIQAQAPAALNADIQAISTMFALTEMVSDQDRSMAEKLRVCLDRESACDMSANGQPPAMFQSVLNQNINYKAAQNSDGDSIAYKIVSEVQKLDLQRQAFEKINAASDKNQADGLMALDGSTDLRDKIVAEINKDSVIAKVDDGSGGQVEVAPLVTAAWDDMKMITNAIRTTQRFTAIAIIQRTESTMTAIGQIVDQRIASLGDAGQCWVKAHPVAPAAPPVPKTSTLIDLGQAIGRFATNAPAAPATPNKPVVPSKDCNNPVAGGVLQNLLDLKGDMAKANALVKTVVTNDVNAIAAPLQIDLIKNKVSRKENDVLKIRELFDVAMGQNKSKN